MSREVYFVFCSVRFEDQFGDQKEKENINVGKPSASVTSFVVEKKKYGIMNRVRPSNTERETLAERNLPRLE